MVTAKQKREIQKRMRAIKEARNNGASDEKIKRLTNNLVVYLDREGITNVFDE